MNCVEIHKKNFILSEVWRKIRNNENEKCLCISRPDEDHSCDRKYEPKYVLNLADMSRYEIET